MAKFFNDLEPQVPINNRNNNNKNNKNKGEKAPLEKKDQIIIILTIVIIILGAIFLIISLSKDKEKNKEEKKENTSSSIIDKPQEQPTEPEPTEPVVEKENYVLVCKQQTSEYTYANKITFNKTQNKVVAVNNIFHITNLNGETTDEDFKRARSSALSTELMLITFALDQDAPGVTVNEYKKEQDVLDLDIYFVEDEMDNDELKDAMFKPLREYTMDTMYELAQSDICSIE